MGRNPSKSQPIEPRLSSNLTPYSRRSVFRAVTVTSLPFLAGCSDFTEFLGGNPGEVTVFNNTDSSLTATVTITDISTEETVLSETADIDSSEAAKFNDVFASATRYRFEAETADGLSSSYEWELPSTDHFLYITINSDDIEFEENEP